MNRQAESEATEKELTSRIFNRFSRWVAHDQWRNKSGNKHTFIRELADDLISKAIYWELPIVSGVFFQPFVYSRHATRNRESPNRFAGD